MAVPDLKPCSICKLPMAVKHLVSHCGEQSIPVDIALCKSCDYLRCGYGPPDSRCGAMLLDIRAKRCPNGHWV